MKSNFLAYLFMFLWPLLIVGIMIIWQWSYVKGEFAGIKWEISKLEVEEREKEEKIIDTENTGDEIVDENGNVYQFKSVTNEEMQIKALDSVKKKLELAGYTILKMEDINQDGEVEMVAYIKQDIIPGQDWVGDYGDDYVVTSDFVIYSYMGGNLPDVVLKVDKYNSQWMEITVDNIDDTAYFVMFYDDDPFGNMQFGLMPINQNGEIISQGGGLSWHPFLGRYEMYCCGREFPNWWPKE
ncbi:hypothetical protein KJ855_02495 [Patescibacteria group bacterium]|nr:hypothetical protein [Patescibacteria group bacterium]